MFARLLMLSSILFLVGCASTNPSRASYAPSTNANETKSHQRMIAYRYSISLDVKDTVIAQESIKNRLDQDGGYSMSERDKAMTIRVPAEKGDSFVEFLRTVGTITSKSKNGEDITESYQDTAAKLATLKASRDQYYILFKKATKVEDMLAIEKELTRVNSEINSLERQIITAKNSVAYTSMTIYLDDSKKGPLGWIYYGLKKSVTWLFVIE